MTCTEFPQKAPDINNDNSFCWSFIAYVSFMKFVSLACSSWHQWSLLGKLFLVYLPHKWYQKLLLLKPFPLLSFPLIQTNCTLTDLLTSSETNWALTLSQTVPHGSLKKTVPCASPNQTVSCTTPKRKAPYTWNNTSPPNKLYFTFLPTKPSPAPRALPNKLYLALLLTNLNVCASTIQTVTCTSPQNELYLALLPTKLLIAPLPKTNRTSHFPQTNCSLGFSQRNC